MRLWHVGLDNERSEREETGREGGRGSEGGKERGRSEGGGSEEGTRVGRGWVTVCIYHLAHSTAHSTAVPTAEVLVPCHLMDRMLWAQCTVHYNGTIHMYSACLFTCILHWHSHMPCGMYIHVHVHHMRVMMSAALGGSRGILQPQSSPHTHT